MKRMESFNSAENYDVVISNGTQFSSDNERELYNTALYGTEKILEKFLQYYVVFQTTCPTWRKTFLIENNIRWDEEAISWQDVDFHIKCFSKQPKYKWGDIKHDNLIRNEKDENRITSSKNMVNKIINGFELYEKWLLNKENKPTLLKYSQVYFLNKIEFLLSGSEIRQLLNDKPKLIKKHLGTCSMIYLKIYSYSCNIKYLNGIVYRSRYLLTGISRKKTKY